MPHIPKGVSFDTLTTIIEGWSAVGADEAPRRTGAVEEQTGIADAVSRQTRFLESVGVLAADGRKHELTDAGRELAAALAADDDGRARAAARTLLADWALTDDVRGILSGNPLPESDIVPFVAHLAGADPDSGRVETGVRTLLDMYEWAGLLETADGRYRLPPVDDPAESTGLDGVLDSLDSESVDASRLVELAGPRADGSGEPDDSVGSPALSLRVDVAADPDDLEAIVRALRAGLTADE